MGLSISHDCWQGTCSSFNRFRYSLGYQIGINLDDYNGYGNNGFKDLNIIESELIPLFDHSDCDGRLTIRECRSIVKGLNKVLKNFNEKLEMDYDFRDNVIKFRDGCLNAISDRKMVHFH